jgi:hypothetical protein
MYHTCFDGKGKDEHQYSRRVKGSGGRVVLEGLEALSWYSKYMGAVDAGGQGIGAFSIDFRCNGKWYHRIVFYALDSVRHNLWVLAKSHRDVDEQGNAGPRSTNFTNKGNCYCYPPIPGLYSGR